MYAFKLLNDFRDDELLSAQAVQQPRWTLTDHVLLFWQNLPFSVDNKWRLLGMMVVFFGSGFAFPFIVVRHQILKK